MPKPESAPRPVFHSIQVLRFVAAMAVVISHATEAQNLFMPEYISLAADHVLLLGATGVHVFFVISGFIMVQTSKGMHGWAATKEFLFRRATRIYPIYWILAAAYLLSHAILLPPYDISPASAVLAFLLIPGWEVLIIGPAWTLAYELFFYLCFGASLLLHPRYSLIVLTLVFVVLVGLGVVWPTPIKVFTGPLLLEFLAGAWIARLLPSFKWHQGYAGGLLIFGSSIGFALTVIFGYDVLPRLITWGIPSVALIAGAAMLEKHFPDSPVLKRLSWLGDSSYALYLSHILVLDLLLTLIVNVYVLAALRPFAIIIGTIVSFMAGLAIHTLIEKPALKALRIYLMANRSRKQNLAS